MDGGRNAGRLQLEARVAGGSVDNALGGISASQVELWLNPAGGKQKANS